MIPYLWLLPLLVRSLALSGTLLGGVGVRPEPYVAAGPSLTT